MDDLIFWLEADDEEWNMSTDAVACREKAKELRKLRNKKEKANIGVDVAQGKDRTIAPTLLERISEQRDMIRNEEGLDADLRININAKTAEFLREQLVQLYPDMKELKSLFGMPVIIDYVIPDMGFVIIHWQPDTEGK